MNQREYKLHVTKLLTNEKKEKEKGRKKGEGKKRREKKKKKKGEKSRINIYDEVTSGGMGGGAKQFGSANR